MRIGKRRPKRLAELRIDSRLRAVDARLKLGLVLVITLSVMLPLPRLALFSLALVALLAFGGLLRDAFYQLERIALLLVVLFLLDWKFIGLDFAVLITFRFAIIVCASVLLLNTTTSEELRQGLRGLGVPYRYAFVLSLAFLSVPLMCDEWRNVREAQKARGLNPKREGWRELPHILQDIVSLAVPAVVLTTRRAWSLTEAAHARGFGSPHMGRPPGLPNRWSDWGLLASAISVLALLIVLP